MTPEPIRVEFNAEQRERVLDEAGRRYWVGTTCKPRNGAPSCGPVAWQFALIGAAGEMAAAILLDCENRIYLDKRPVRGNADLPGHIEVKARSAHWHDLIIQIDDDPTKRFILVTIQRKRILIRGWCYGREAMRENNKADPAGGRPAHFVSKAELRPMATLFVQESK